MTTTWLRYAKVQSDRFWSKVRRTKGATSTRCWAWQGGRDKDGYGKFAITLPAENGRNPQAHVRAHRVAFALTKGDPKRLSVLHSCDNPCCCNPAHLRTGTQAMNRLDCVKRNRQPRGERHSRAKLTAADVRAIRAAAGKQTSRELAIKYGCSYALIGHIWTGRLWRHLLPSNSAVRKAIR